MSVKYHDKPDMGHCKNIVLLLNFPPSITSSYTGKGSVYPNTAIILIGSLLKKHGFHVRIIDCGYHENYIDILKQEVNEYRKKILYIGMSVMTTQVPHALKASKAIKTICKEIPVVWGGAHPTLFPKQTIRNSNIDIISINEGSITALRLAEAFQNKHSISTIKGIGYQDETDEIIITPCARLEDINELPQLDFSLIKIDNYINTGSVWHNEFSKYQDGIKALPILTGLGCPYKCQFCINVILKRRYRYRKADSIIDEIRHLQDKYGANTFIFMDEDFFINKNRVMEFVANVEKENMHFNWRMWCRVDHFKENYINKALIDRLDRIGYGSIVMGGESGNQESLNSLAKGITTEQILYSLQLLKGSNINARYSFMVGLENETNQKIKDSYRFCLMMKTIDPEVDIAGPFIFRLYPGSPIYDRLVERYHIKIPEELDLWEDFLIKNEDMYTENPWVPEKFRKQFKYVQFYAAHAMKYEQPSYKVKAVLRQVLTMISKFRIQRFFFNFPLEYLLANYASKVWR